MDNEKVADDVVCLIVLQLLQRDIKKRLGCRHMGGLEAFKAHPWFKEYDWTVLERKEAIPPFEPDVRFSFTDEVVTSRWTDSSSARLRSPRRPTLTQRTNWRSCY